MLYMGGYTADCMGTSTTLLALSAFAFMVSCFASSDFCFFYWGGWTTDQEEVNVRPAFRSIP